MIFHGVPWRCAAPKDQNYVYYIEHRHGHFEPFLRIPPQLAHLIENVLEPDPSKRFSTNDICADPFFSMIEVCGDRCIDASGRKHHHFTIAYETAHVNGMKSPSLVNESTHTMSKSAVASPQLSGSDDRPLPPPMPLS